MRTNRVEDARELLIDIIKASDVKRHMLLESFDRARTDSSNSQTVRAASADTRVMSPIPASSFSIVLSTVAIAL